jgi:hypothetical protein
VKARGTGPNLAPRYADFEMLMSTLKMGFSSEGIGLSALRTLSATSLGKVAARAMCK